MGKGSTMAKWTIFIRIIHRCVFQAAVIYCCCAKIGVIATPHASDFMVRRLAIRQKSGCLKCFQNHSNV